MQRLQATESLPNNEVKKQKKGINLEYIKTRVLGVLQNTPVISPDILEILLNKNYMICKNKLINMDGDSNKNFFLELQAWENNGKDNILKRKGVVNIKVDGKKESKPNIFIKTNKTKQVIDINRHPNLHNHILSIID